MKNGVIKITGFSILNEIAYRNRVKAKDWAMAAWGGSQYASRISELRKLQSQFESGTADEKVGRVLSAEKMRALLEGLKSILGGELVKKELLDKLAKVKTEREKNLILLMAADEKDQKQIRLYLETVIEK